ncbi:MAG: hypothetical protein AAF543_01950 [Pseudomonadota bacterium]
MSGQYRWLPAFLLVAFGAATTHAAEKSQFTCTSGDLVRRVIIEVGDLATGLPCEVVYWKDKEAPGVRRVLWNARSDAAFCDGKASGLVDKLATAGWSCDASGEPVQANAGAAASQPAATAPASTTTVPAVDAATTAAPQQPAAQPSASQSQTAGLDSATAPGVTQQLAPAASLSNAPSATGSTGTANTGTAGAAGSEDLRTAALTPAPSTSSAASVDQLQTVIEANLASLNQSVDGDFQAQIGDFGDLNNDGIDDAVVFFNYESSTADFTQFVAAYLFNGENYHLAATKPVGGTDLAVRQVEVEQIINGSIQLRLLLNDASQTEDRRAAMIFKDGQLVETE